MTTKNDITGDLIKSRSSSEAYRDNYDRIFGKKKEDDEKPLVDPNSVAELQLYEMK